MKQLKTVFAALIFAIGAQVAAQPTAEITRLQDLNLQVEAERPAAIPTEHFAGRNPYRKYSISPDGSHLAIERSQDDKSDILLMDAATQEVLKIYSFGEEQELDWFRWAGPDKLIMSLSSKTTLQDNSLRDFTVRLNRIYVRNIVDNSHWMLELPSTLLWGGELVHVAEDGSFALVSVQRSAGRDPSVYRYELVPGAERERVVSPTNGIWNWFADDAGVVRLGSAWRHGRLRIYYRRTEDDDFKLVDVLDSVEERRRTWRVVKISADSDQGYVLADDDDGRVGVRLFDYSTGETLETLYENPDWDVSELWFERDGTPLAALYTDDRDQIEWFDEEWGAMFRNLGDALGLPDLRIISRSLDNERMLIWGGSESDPGAYYIFTPAERSLELLGNHRPQIEWENLAKPMPIRYRARDGLMISGYLTLPRGVEPKDLPLIVMPHGGPFGVRDTLSYNDEVQLLANRGYAVLQPNFRGSGGYGDAFYEAGQGQVGRGMQDDIDDAMDWAVGQGIADAQRVCVVGGSYGGFSALWAVIRNPERYACAASWAGVTDWDRLMQYDRDYLGRQLSRFSREQLQTDADLGDFSPVSHANTLSRPVLLAHGTEDQRVPVSQFRAFQSASENAPVRPRFLLIDGAGHGFSKAEYEQEWYDALIAFLNEHNPADAPPEREAVAEIAVSSVE